MEVWGFRPQMNVSETLEWATSITRCKKVEYRQCLRPIPRQEMAYSYIQTPNEYGKAVEIARKIGVDDCYWPVWTDAVQIASTTEHEVALYLDTTKKCYAAGGYCMLWDGDLHFEVVPIDVVNATYLALAAPTVDAYADPWVMPCRIGPFTQEFAADREGVDSYVRSSASLIATATEDLAFQYGAGIAYPIGPLGTDTGGLNTIVTDPTYLINGVRESQTRRMETVEAKAGPIVNYALHATATQTSVVSWHCYNATDVWNRRVWLHAMRGQLKQAWFPSWNQDVTLAADIDSGATTITINAVGWASAYPNPTYMAIFLTDGSLATTVPITGVASTGTGTETLSISGSAFGSTIPKATVSKVARIALSRFASDRIEIQHLPGRQAQIVVPIQEVPTYGLPGS